MYEFATAGTWKEDTQHPLIRWGLLALVCMDLLFLFSISVFRQMFYNVFYITHVISAVVMLAAVSVSFRRCQYIRNSDMSMLM